MYSSRIYGFIFCDTKVINSSIGTLESDLIWESKRFFHFSSTGAPSGYRAIQIVFNADATSPILIFDADKNCLVVLELWDNVTTLRAANICWINNANTIENVQCAKHWDNTQYRIKITYKTLISMGGFLSLDGKGHFNSQDFVDQ